MFYSWIFKLVEKVSTIARFFFVLCGIALCSTTVYSTEPEQIELLVGEIESLKAAHEKLENEVANLKKQLQRSGGRKEPIRDLEKVTIKTDSDPVLGDENAKIVMIEFSDYQCPFCKRHKDSVWPEIMKNFVDSGKLNMYSLIFLLVESTKKLNWPRRRLIVLVTKESIG